MTRPTRREFLASAAAIAAFSGSIGATQSEGAGRTTAGSGSTGSGPSPLERRKFGATDMTVTVLGFGGAEIGYQDVDQAIVDRLLNSALDAGLNVIDTAECYADSEEAIGRSVSGRRNDYFLFTKVGHMEPGEAGWTPASIERSIDRSLERLKTDRVDLVQLHSCDIDTLKRGACIDALVDAWGPTRIAPVAKVPTRKDADRLRANAGDLDEIVDALITDHQAKLMAAQAE